MKYPWRVLPSWGRNNDLGTKQKFNYALLYLTVVLGILLVVCFLGNVIPPAMNEDYQVFERVNSAFRLIIH